MTSAKFFKVEMLKDNTWIVMSRHRNDYNAINMASVLHSSRKLPVKVIKSGVIIWDSLLQKGGGNIDK